MTRNAPDGQVTLIDGAGILAAWDTTAVVGASQHGSVEADDDPDHDSDTPDTVSGSSLISLFQTNTWAFRALISAAWDRPRAGSVAVLTGADWAEAEGEA